MKLAAHWQAISGDFFPTENTIVFHGGTFTVDGLGDATPNVKIKDGIALSNLRLSNGSIIANIKYTNARLTPVVGILFYYNPLDGSFLSGAVEGAFSAELAGQARFSILGYDGSQNRKQFEWFANTPYVKWPSSRSFKLEVNVRASNIELKIDDISVLKVTLPFQVLSSNCGLFCSSESDVTIENYSAESKFKTAFMVMQFSPPFDGLFEDAIMPVAKTAGIHVEKADDTYGPGFVISDIMRRIDESDIVIADITPNNPNVFYEVGYAHAIKKPVILLAEKGKALPFDVSSYRTLFYENTISGKSRFQEGLRRHIEAILDGQKY